MSFAVCHGGHCLDLVWWWLFCGILVYLSAFREATETDSCMEGFRDICMYIYIYIYIFFFFFFFFFFSVCVLTYIWSHQ